MTTLSKLPVFLDLSGKRAVVAGGAPPAAWKAELLAAAGAHVDVYTGEPSEEMQDLARRNTERGIVTVHVRPWSSDVLSGAAVAIADVETEAEARAFACAARTAGVLCNVIDKPAFCQFQLGSIVNRSPVVVAISTDGGAPVLGQAIRRRIETLLPPTLTAWGARAKEMRAAVNARLAPGPHRRAFWERFAERAMASREVDRNVPALEQLLDEFGTDSSPLAGRVTLVGAGPGDAELLTLKAVRAMQSADVILYDDLVSDEVLELARREAKRIAVGKRGRRDSCAQADINGMMISLASEGRHVVRLKSGDPMIFGRAGEEIAALSAHGIPFEVVPGVTSALAAAASLGVSLTHRDCAQSVRFVTGHGRDGALPMDLDWQGLADARTTLVFYMGGRTAPLIADRLIKAGLPKATAAVVVTSATRPSEQRWLGDLRSLAKGAARIENSGPVLIGIGTTFAAACNSPSQDPLKVLRCHSVESRRNSSLIKLPTCQALPKKKAAETRGATS